MTSKEQFFLDVFVETLIIKKCMGKALDYGRMSGMTDRSLEQFSRSVKNDYYQIVSDAARILKEKGYPISDTVRE